MNKLVIAIAILAASALALSLYKGGLHAPKEELKAIPAAGEGGPGPGSAPADSRAPAPAPEASAAANGPR